jgi:predicted MFS family arabinose efflux permease
VSATTLAVALAAPFVGLIAERIGRKRVIVPALFGLAVPTLLAATSTGLRTLIFWRFLQGLFIPGIIAVIMAYIGEEWPAKRVGSVMSAYVTGTVFGGFVGRFTAGVITAHFDWRWSFVLLGLITVAGAVAVSRWLPPAVNFVPTKSARATLRSAARHLRNGRLLATFLMAFTVLFTLVGTFTYANFYMAAPPFGLNSAQLGSVFFVYLLGLVVTPMAGRYLDLHGYRKAMMLAFVLCMAGLTVTLRHSLPMVILGLALLSSGVFALQACNSTNLGKVAGQARSSAAGLYVTFYYVGGSVGAVLPSWFWVRGGWPATVGVLAVAALVALTLGFLASRKPAAAHRAA